MDVSTSVIESMAFKGDGLRRTKVTHSGVKTYVWDGADYLAEETGGALEVIYGTMIGQLVEENRGGTVTEYVPDTLGSVIKTTNSSGTVTSSTTYWPYGETNASTGTNPSPFGYVGTWGYYSDSPARTYRPDLSRWLTVDPLWPKESTYCYGIGEPISLTDPGGSGAQPASTRIWCSCYPAAKLTVTGLRKGGQRNKCYQRACFKLCSALDDEAKNARVICERYGIVGARAFWTAFDKCVKGNKYWAICGKRITIADGIASNGAEANVSNYPAQAAQFFLMEPSCEVECTMRLCCANLNASDPIEVFYLDFKRCGKGYGH